MKIKYGVYSGGQGCFGYSENLIQEFDSPKDALLFAREYALKKSKKDNERCFNKIFVRAINEI